MSERRAQWRPYLYWRRRSSQNQWLVSSSDWGPVSLAAPLILAPIHSPGSNAVNCWHDIVPQGRGICQQRGTNAPDSGNHKPCSDLKGDLYETQFDFEKSRLSKDKRKTPSDGTVAWLRHPFSGREWHELNG